MIITSVHVPPAYVNIPSDKASEAIYCDAILAILKDIERNGIWLVDDQGLIIARITEALGNWPEKHSTHARELLKQLKKRNRIVSCKLLQPFAPIVGCGQDCAAALALARSRAPDLVIGVDGCKNEPGSRVCVGEYQTAKTDRGLDFLSDLIHTENEFTKPIFEQKVLRPIFRYAKHIKLYDRIIGHTYTSLAQNRTPVRFPDSFRAGIESIYELFERETRGRQGRIFEIYTALECQHWFMTPDVIRECITSMQDFAESISRGADLKMIFKVKKESMAKRMPHARYMVTNQFAFAIDRGFDLLDAKRNVRDFVLQIVPDKAIANIETQIMALPDA